jgi:predicted ester cyclase
MKKLIYVATLLTCLVVPTYSYAEETMAANSPKAATPNPELAVIKAFYDLLSSHDDATLATRAAPVVDVDWIDDPVSLGGQGLTGFVNTFTAYHQVIPDMKWTPQRILKSGHTYTVRSIGSGTPVADFLGIGADWVKGNRFEIMSIDIHKVKNGKIVHSYHVEDWKHAIEQLKAK